MSHDTHGHGGGGLFDFIAKIGITVIFAVIGFGVISIVTLFTIGGNNGTSRANTVTNSKPSYITTHPIPTLNLSIGSMGNEYQSQLNHMMANWDTSLIRQKTAELGAGVTKMLEAEGVPGGLYWLMVVEDNTFSSGNPWQLSASTAELYGCPADKRGDMNYATPAAARLLRRLYQIYGDWYLVIAAYNWGTVKLDSVIKLYGKHPPLPQTTRDHIARVAALPEIIGKFQSPLIQNMSITTKFAWPTTTRIETSEFGELRQKSGGRYYEHGGADVDATYGDPIFVVADGIVVEALNTGWNGGHGKMVRIDHGNGLRTLYAHCSEVLVSVGQRVEKGQVIARIGNSGKTTSRGGDGSHLHIEFSQNGQKLDPMPFLRGSASIYAVSGALPPDYPRYPAPLDPPKLPKKIDPRIAKILGKMNI